MDDHVALERFLYDWEEAQRATVGSDDCEVQAPSLAYEWCDAIAFLPATDGCAAPAYMSFFNAQSFGHERLVVALRHWQQQFGIEVMASIGTQIVLRVTRPPRSIDVAWQTALEIDQLCDHWDTSLRDRARSLLVSRDWVLISRP